MDSRENLIAVDRTNQEIAQIIGADSVGYLSVDSVQRLMGNDPSKGYCTACFGGKYPTEPPADTRKYRFTSAITV